ncbi:MAG: hypothetical protein ACM3X1_09345 [Ignavibacteriales bacterium]
MKLSKMATIKETSNDDSDLKELLKDAIDNRSIFFLNPDKTLYCGFRFLLLIPDFVGQDIVRRFTGNV